ncbi:MAG: hypothetical protein IPG45_23845 [Deltaproteobacteria bacterium]|nr:hypothetical protein [Deltaproteobacteria bacterium]
MSTAGLLLLLFTGPTTVDPVGAALEVALRNAPSDVLRLAMAEYLASAQSCERAERAYLEFFAACGDCALREAAVTGLDQSLAHCFTSLSADDTFREALGIRPALPNAPAPATLGELRRLAVARGQSTRVFDPLIGLGSFAPYSAATMERLRAEGWRALRSLPVRVEELERLLWVAPDLDPAWVRWLRQESAAASADPERLEVLRREILIRYADPAPFESCVTGQPRSGYLTLSTKPEAEVYVSGELVGTTPLAHLKVPLGSGPILLRDPVTDQAYSLSVELQLDRVTIVRAQLNDLTRMLVPLDQALEEARTELPRRRAAEVAICHRVEAERAVLGGHLDRASAELGACLALRPEAWDCWRSLASLELRREAPDRACPALRRYLALRPQAGDRAWVEGQLASACR